MKNKVCMIVPSFSAKGGITSVVKGYKGSVLEEAYEVKYIETYCEGTKVKKLFKALKGYNSFRKLIKNDKPDIIHIHSSFGASFFRKKLFIDLGARKKIPIINHIHGSEIEKLYVNAPKWKRKIIERTLDKCSLIITLSKETREKLAVVKTKTEVEVLSNYSTPHPIRFECRENVVLFLGFITRLKGCFDIPEVVLNVVNEFPNVKFILAGVGEDKAIKAILESKNIANKVEFPGWIQDEKKELVFNKSSIFFLPSYTEAMPVSILESMGYGLPIVATNVGGIPQLVRDGENGFLHNPGDCVEMANSIVRLLKDPNLLKKMGEESYRIALSEYSKDNHINKLMQIYRKVIE